MAMGALGFVSFNAKKSGIMVYGEGKAKNSLNAQKRVFKLGPDVVKERVNYDHVGVRSTLYDDDVSGLSERISKARRAFYSITGIGIRRKSLNMSACSIIFWSIIVPIATFGCELLVLSDKSISLLETFQEHIGKRIQRLGKYAPNVCSFYTLGWLRLERYVEVKKLLFIRIDNREYLENSPSLSPVLDLIKTAATFGLIEYIRNFIRNGCNMSKQQWKCLVWRRACDLDTIYWNLQARSHKSLENINSIFLTPRYLSWWQLSDLFS